MRITGLTIKNMGAVADVQLNFDHPLLLFYGEIRQGKTTILNCVRWLLGAPIPADIIRHGCKEASAELTLDNGSISRSFYRNKEGQAAARPVRVVQDGKPVSDPAKWIKSFANPFLLNQDHLKEMSEADRRKFFVEILGVDTTALDKEAATLAGQASQLRTKIGAYGDIDLTEVRPVNVGALRQQLNMIRAERDKAVQQWQADCAMVRREHEAACDAIRSTYNAESAEVNKVNAKAVQRADYRRSIQDRVVELKEEIATLQDKLKTCERILLENPELERKTLPSLPKLPPEPALPPSPAMPDTVDLENKIQNAAAQNVRVEQYQKNLAREKLRKTDEAALTAAEARQRAIKAEKVAKLADLSKNSKICGLAFDEEGNFTFEGTSAGMLSGSQLKRLSSELSALYPDGFGVELVDAGESLGRAIFEYSKYAEDKKRTVLATVVGDRPSTVPDRVGVFVVKDGVVFKDGHQPEQSASAEQPKLI